MLSRILERTLSNTEQVEDDEEDEEQGSDHEEDDVLGDNELVEDEERNNDCAVENKFDILKNEIEVLKKKLRDTRAMKNKLLKEKVAIKNLFA